MPHEKTDVLDMEDVQFIETLHSSRPSSIYLVKWHGKRRVLKVYHGKSYEAHATHEISLFVCESTAYRRLKSEGVCQRGIVPDFYGVFTNIETHRWPQLCEFHNDTEPVHAILLEHVPNFERIHKGNIDMDAMKQFSWILNQIHAAGVVHEDLYPRNMGFSGSGTKQRFLMLDFDRAQTVMLDGKLPTHQKDWFEDEQYRMNEWISGLSDHLGGHTDMWWARHMSAPIIEGTSRIS